MQTLLRGVVPNSFPCQLSLTPAQPGERRLVVIDDNVYRLYGDQLRKVIPQVPYIDNSILWWLEGMHLNTVRITAV